jgi:Putative transposase
VLHTWTRELAFHPHVHCVVTGGGLADDGSRWVSAPSEFLFPVRVLAALFRGKVLDGVARARRDGKRRLAPEDEGRAAARRTDALHRASWIVYAKRPFGGPEQVYRYLGRYTHRVAISNSRLVSATDETVTFRTRGDQTATLPPLVFLSRFLQQVLSAEPLSLDSRRTLLIGRFLLREQTAR